MKNRMIFLCGSALLMVFIICASPRFCSGMSQGLTLIAATDLHYLAPELTDHGAYFREVIENADGKAMEYCEELTEAFVEQVIEQAPDALILSGDLTFNGAALSHRELAQKLDRIEDAGIPVFVLPGNHDLENPMAASFRGDGFTLTDNVDAAKFAEIYGSFGYRDALARDRESLSYTTRLAQGLRLLMVDANTAGAPGTVTDDTLHWVEQQLQEAVRQRDRVLAVSHQNLLAHNSLFSYGFVMGNRDKLLELYERYHVICNLSGHMHVQHIAASGQGLPEIAGSCLMTSPNQYGVLSLKGRKAEYHTIPVDVLVKEGQSENPDLQDFPSYARNFLWETACRQAASELPDDEKGRRRKQFFADVNTAYIAGRMDTVSWEEALYQEWGRDADFLYVYLQSIADDGFQDHTEYSFWF